MDEQIKEELIERFRTYLESENVPEPPKDTIDRMSLFNEVAGLKNEVRIESRQIKGALDDFRQAFTSLDDANQDVTRTLQHIQHMEKDSARLVMNPVILGLIDLYDRISAGLTQRPPKNFFLESIIPGRQQRRKWLQGHQEGQRMILGRVLDLLGQCGVTQINTKGEPFDPNYMKAVGSESDSQQARGLVLHENRKGFLQGERSIRTAEVIVNKSEE